MLHFHLGECVDLCVLVGAPNLPLLFLHFVCFLGVLETVFVVGHHLAIEKLPPM